MGFNKNISKLDLSNKGLEYLPTEIFKLKNLKKLNLSYNKLKSIPKELSELKRLENLNISHNLLTSIYAYTCNLKNIHTLILNNNKIKTIPTQITRLTKIKKLSISSNRLSSLPKSMNELINLESLNIANNEFESFPIEILLLKNLNELWINNNNFNSFPLKEILSDLKSLKKLYCFGVTKNTREGIDHIYMQLSSIKGNSLVNLKKLLIKDERKPKKRVNSSDTPKNKIFISYSRKDIIWLEKVEEFLKSMQYEGIKFDFWSDKRIRDGDNWKKEIEKALNDSFIAVLIVSSAFLASDFIQSNELPQILENANSKGTKVLSLIIRPCRFRTSKLAIFQSVNEPNLALNGMSENEQDNILLKLTEDIEEYLK